MKKIEKEEVEFDDFGQWWHSAICELGEEYDEMPFVQIPAFVNLDLMPIRIYDEDKVDLLCGVGMEAGPADFRKWQPEPPKGNGWFPFLFGDDEDGPFVMYAREKIPE